jgi:DNA invertase Pin-like site-specific DNA recombinase
MASPSLRAVTYLRKSTDKQEASIPDQREAVATLARQKGYSIVREYKDEGISGDDTERRPGFLQLLDDVKRLGDFDCVLCWDQDRFGRFDPLEAGYWIKPLRDRGIFLETVAQGRIDWEDFAGRIVYAVQQEGKHAFLRDMSRNVTRGMLAKAKRGEWVGGPVPYGYRLNGHKRLEPGDPAEVETVRWLYTSYANSDTSFSALAAELNERGVPAPGRRIGVRGKPTLWQPATVRDILTRPVYLGDTIWNRRHDGRYHSITGGEIRRAAQKNARHANPPEDWVWVENTHEPLVDRATFERVQRRRAERCERRTPHRGGGAFLLSGLLRCGHCSWPMHGYTETYTTQGGERRRYRRYCCGNYNLHGRAGGCSCNTVRETRMLDILIRVIQDEFLKPANLRALNAEIRRQEEAERAGRERPAADLDRRIGELTRKSDEGTERWLSAPPSLTAVLGAKLEQWRQELEALEARGRELAKPAASAADLDRAVDAIAAGLATLRERVGDADAAAVREVLRGMVERVELFFRREPFGRKREKSVLERGTVYLREELVTAQVSIVNVSGPARAPG